MKAQRPKENRRLALATAPLVLFLLLFFAYPVARLCVLSFADPEGPLASYARLLSVPAYRAGLMATFGISSLVTILSVLCAYPVAYLMASVRPRLAALLGLCVLLPFWTSSLVRTTAWIILLQRYGVINSLLLHAGLIRSPISFIYNLSGVLIGMTHVLMPFVVLPLYSAFRGLDRSQLDAAEGLGGSWLKIIGRLVLPLTSRAACSGAAIVFMSALGYYVTPALMGGARETMAAQLIAFNVEDQLDWPMAGAFSSIIVAASVMIFACAQRLSGPGGLFGSPVKATQATRSDVAIRRSPLDWGVAACGAALLFFLILPLLIIAPMSFGASPFMSFPPEHLTWRWYHQVFTRPQWRAALWNSLQIGMIAVTGATILGSLAAIGLDALRGRVRTAAEMLIIMPMIAPAIALAIGLYYEFAPLHLLSGHWGLGLGHIVLASPFVFIAVRSALQRFDPTLLDAATGLGAGPLRVTYRVLLPAIAPGVAAGAIFAFVTSFDDVVLALFLTDVRSRTLPRLIYENVSQDINPTVAVASTLVALATLLVLSINLLLTKSKS
ncbi:ABC transporter permease subunit [Acetobacter sacchari]|uniref:ABC transporter permease subunit n=1 Tax=Acetobacter sacchari TaxID=2661687 RepID=A0ABS3LRI1_9PROT|nr:ABC transporter permease subunit [Acetobacter sacchari]MBO1358505.1 ABC transporter permease subunit [Acetobacter sacchari]